MSPPDSIEEKGPRQFNIFTAMLAVALVLILIAIALLAMELQRYDFDINAQTAWLSPQHNSVVASVITRV